MQSFLITGDSALEITKKVNHLRKDYKITPFNILNIVPDPSIGIEAVRKIKQFFILSPIDEGKRMVILNQMELATPEAQNAMLKILEEPPQNTYIILLSRYPDILLPTILSRTQMIKVGGNSDIILKRNDNKEILILLLNENIGPKIKFAENVGKTKDDALNFIDQFLPFLHTELKNKLSKSLLISQLIKKFIKARELLKQNTNPRLTLEVLFIGIKGFK